MAETGSQHERVEITVEGRVQGVAFRYYTRDQAQALGLTGWVRNQPDGSVRMVAEGPRPALEAFVRWTASGPGHARVDNQTVFWSDPAGSFDSFDITG